MPCRLFLLLWALQTGGMLLAPRLLGSRMLPVIAASPLLQCHPGSLAWPIAALFVCASVTGVWGEG